MTKAVTTTGGGNVNIDNITNNSNAPGSNIGVVSYRVFSNRGDIALTNRTETVGCTTSGNTIVLRYD